jgi:hypothetical protein
LPRQLAAPKVEEAVKLSAASRRKRRALETAARELRAAQGSDRDEILAARRALRQAEKFYDRAVARAQRDLNIARAPSPIAAYGSRLILYDDRLSTPARTFALVPSVRAQVTDRTDDPSSVDLVVEGPEWRELVTGPKRDEQILRQLAGAVDQAARQVDAVSTARQPETEFAEGRLAAARVERLGIAEAKPLLDRLAQLNDEGERAALLHRGQGIVQFGNVANPFPPELHAKGLRCPLGCVKSMLPVGPVSMPKVVNWHLWLTQFDGELHVFAAQVCKYVAEPGSIATWMRKAFDEPYTHRIADRNKYDRNG